MIQTTLVQLIDRRIRLSRDIQLWTSLEGENPGESIKDRMVLPELLQLKTNDINSISEISAGSTALSLAFYSQKFGLKCELFVPSDVHEVLKKKLIQYGALLTECDPSTAYQNYENFCRASKGWRFNQMQRKELRFHYKKWAEEQLAPKLPADLDFIIGAVGTGHSLLGIKMALKPKFGCVVAEPERGHVVHGVRNLDHQNFGPEDPCELSLIENRKKVAADQFFRDYKVESDCGIISIADSFRLTLGAAVSFLSEIHEPAKVFLVGAQCKFLKR